MSARPSWAAVAAWSRAHRWQLAVAGLTLLAFALRVREIGESYYGDEGFTIDDVVDRPLGEAMSRVREYEDTPPFFFLVSWLAARVGDPLVWLRITPLVAGTALVPLTFALGARLVSRRAGLLGAALLTLSPFAVHFATEARSYSLLVFLAVASTYSLVRALEGPPSRVWWVAFWASTVLTLYTHYTGFFVIAAQVAWAFGFHRGAWRRLAAAYGLVGIAIAPWMLTRPESHAAAFEALYPFSIEESLRYWGQSLAGTPQVGIQYVPGTFGWILVGAAGATCAAGLVLARRGDGPRPGAVALLGLAGLAAPVGLVAYSLVSSSVIAGRNMFVSAPFLFLLFGTALDRLGRRLMIVPAALAASGLVVGMAIADKPRWGRPAWKDAASYLEARAEPRDPIVIGSHGTPPVGERALFLQGLANYMEDANLVGLDLGDRRAFQSIEPSRRVWVVVQSAIGGFPPTPPVLSRNFALVSERYFNGINQLAVFGFRREPESPLAGSELRRSGGVEVLSQPGRADRPLGEGHGFLESIEAYDDRIVVAGWAVDKASGRPARAILLFDGGRFLGAARPSADRSDIANVYGRRASRAGFRIEVFTARARSLARLDRLELIGMSGDRAWKLRQVPEVRIER